MSERASREDRVAWLEARRQGIGGSDAAAVLGLSPWTTPLEVYFEKIGEAAEVEETPDMRRGTLLEAPIRQMYADATGREVVTPSEMIRNPTLPFALGNCDGLIPAEAVVECKTARTRHGWGEPGSAEVPIVYLLQVAHYMAVADLPRADLAVLFGDFEFAIYSVSRDEELESLLMEREAAFWRCVLDRTPPDPVSAADIVRRWPKSQPFAVRGGRRELRAAAVLAAVKERIDMLEELKSSAETILKGAIRDAEVLEIDGDVVATWKSAKGAIRFDAKRFQAEHPDLYRDYLSEAASTRRFLLKGGAKCLQSETITLPMMPENLLPAPETAPG